MWWVCHAFAALCGPAWGNDSQGRESMTPSDAPHVPPLQPNDYWIDAVHSAQWFADGVFELVSPLDEEHPTVIELSEEQEVFMEWLTTHHIQHIRVQEVP